MLGITAIFFAIAIACILGRILLEEHFFSPTVGLYLEAISLGALILVHHMWVDVGSTVFMYSMALTLGCWIVSNAMSYLAIAWLGYEDSLSRLDPYWMIFIFLALILRFIPYEGMELLGFPNLFQGYGIWLLSILLLECVFFAIHMWLYYDWDLDNGAFLFHWIFSLMSILFCFAFFAKHTGRSLAWLMCNVLVCMLHLQRTTGLIWLGISREILPLSPRWYLKEIIVGIAQIITLLLIYLVPSLVHIMQLLPI